MSLLVVSGTAPSHWAPYFINGDAEGLSADDIAQADAFAEWLGGVPVTCEDWGFSSWHDARRFGALAADCQMYATLVKDSGE